MNDTIAASLSAPGSEDANLRRALLDSRQRWRDLVMTAADLVYEIDAWGRFILLAPGSGAWLADRDTHWPAGGTAAGSRHGAQQFQSIPAHRADAPPARLAEARPMAARSCCRSPVRRCWMLRDALWAHAAWASTGRNSIADAGLIAASLRRGEVLDHILWCIGQEVLAPRMMQAALDGLMKAVGAEGVAVIDLGSEGGPKLIHRAGGGADEIRSRGGRAARHGQRRHQAAPPGMGGRSSLRPAVPGSARMRALPCGGRPARADGTRRNSRCCARRPI